MTATLLPTAQSNIDSGDFFYVENHGDKPVSLAWAGMPYLVPPGTKKLVPFAAIALYFGDPRSRVGMIQQYKDSTGTGTVPERHAEVQRLCVRYGVYEQGMDDIAGALVLLQAEARANGKPALRDENFSVRITFKDTDEEVVTPLFDHEGTGTTYGFDLDEERSDDIATILNQMKKQAATMQEKIDRLEMKREILDGADNDDDGIELDNPSDLP